MSTLEIIELTALGIAVLGLLVYIIINACKNHWVSQMVDTVNAAMAEAEKKFPEQGSGEKKKEYVMEAVKAKCKDLRIPYAIIVKLVGLLVNRSIAAYNAMSGK